MPVKNRAKQKISIALSTQEVAPDTSEAVYRCLVESLRDCALFAISPIGNVITWSPGAENVFGYTRAEMIGASFGRIFTPEDVAAGAPQTELADAHRGWQAEYERWHVRKDGTRFLGTNTVAPLYDATGALIGFTKLVQDTTQAYRANEALRDSEERLRLLIESIPEYAIFSLSLDGLITTWNAAADSMFGYSEAEVLGKTFAQFVAPGAGAGSYPGLLLQTATERGSVNEERWLIRKDGSRFLASGKLSCLKPGPSGASRGFVYVAHDITERAQLAAELHRRASVDHLTELPNRGTFFEHVHRAIAAMKRRSTNLFAVLFIDLDHFKQVNDTFGHIVADRLLGVTARRLEYCVRSEDVVARIGGDEFAILLNGINSIADARDAADRISAEMQKPVPIDGRTVRATVSVGIALGSPHYDRPEDILHDADAAMYGAKADGRARSKVFTHDLAVVRRTHLDLEADLRHAVGRNELRIAYQPVMRLADSSIYGFEALVRWQHPRRGLLHPMDFLLRAEESDLIIAIDRWVLREACGALAAWRSQLARTDLAMSVNFSRREFSSADAVDELRDVLRATGVPPHCLHLEITESAIMERSDRAVPVLAAIRDLGVGLQIDDFGVGYSSLAALGQMPVSGLKIDRSFVATMDSQTGAGLVLTITQLAQNLGLTTIAEGIETADQLHGLMHAKCEYGQGFLFSEPLDSIAAGRLLCHAG